MVGPIDLNVQTSLTTLSPEQAQFLQILWNGVNYGIVILDVLEEGTEFRYRAFNPAMAKTSPVPVDELVGKTVTEALPAPMATIYRQHFTQCVQTHQALSFEEQFKYEGGTTWWLFTVTPCRRGEDNLECLIVTAIDISEQKAVQAELQEREQTYRQILDAIGDYVLIKGPKSRILFANKAFRDYYGMSEAELRNLIDAPFNEPDYTQQYIKDDTFVFENGQVLEIPEEPVTRHDGVVQLWNTIKSPVFNLAGEVIMTVGISRDITERKAAETELQQTKNFLESILHNLPVSVFAKEAKELRFVLWNPCAEKMLKLTAEEVLGKNDYDFFTKEQADFFTAKDREVLNNSQVLNIFEEEILNGNGEIRLLHTQKTAILDANGQPQYLLAISQDITERKAAEAILQDYAERQTLLNHLANQIRNSLDLDMVLETTIQAIRNLLEIDQCCFAWYHPDVNPPIWEVIKQSQLDQLPSSLGRFPVHLVGPIDQWFLTQDLLQINDVEVHEEPVHRAFLKSLNCKSEVLLPIKTNSKRIGVLICGNYFQHRPWSDREVELLRSVGDQLAIAIDQAELYAQTHAKSQELEKALKELQRTQAQVVQSEKMSSLGQLVAGIAHEINNPVNFIYGNLTHAQEYSQNLLELITLYQHEYPNSVEVVADKVEEIELEFISKDLPKLLTSMKVGTERIREIVKSLRLFSRLDEAEVKAVDIHEGINSTLMILQNRIKAKADCPAIEVIKNYGDLPLVECYAGQLNQVFMNILVNSIDAFEEVNENRTYQEMCNSPNQITICTSVVNSQWVKISIADNGVGVPEAIKNRIFDPFFTTKAVGKGTGMGMSISYQIITEKHKGKLECFSKKGEGTQFVIHIPIRP